MDEELRRYDAIRPFEPEELPAAFDRMLADPQFRAVLAYAVPLITRYRNSLREHLHNAVILSILYLPRTVLMVFLLCLSGFLRK